MGLPINTVAPNLRKPVRDVHDATVRRLTGLDDAAAEGSAPGHLGKGRGSEAG
jgi:hypothetical protein